MRSLIVVSLPRSLSTIVYQQSRLALGLAEPTWTSDGEILNPDRFALSRDGSLGVGAAYLRSDRDRRRFEGMLDFLEQVARPEGFAYKDVVQPFVMAAWLAGSALAALKIERPVTDVAFAMLQRGWDYPGRAAETDGGAPERAVIDGLLVARKALGSIPGPVVRFDDLVFDQDPLKEALAGLYAGSAVEGVAYLDDSFRRVRDRVLERRSSGRYGELDAIRRELEAAAL